MTASNALIIFVKNPEQGKVKTRLAATMGDEKALQIYMALMQRCREVTQALPVKKYLYYGQVLEQGDAWPEQEYFKKVQYQGDLGERMSAAFAEVLRHHRKAVIIGSDIPGITQEILLTAFKKLDDHDLVIGGTEDGGYYLLGMHTFVPSVFSNITWSTQTVFEQTLQIIQSRRKTCFQLPVLVDIDYEEDWLKHGWDL